MEILRYTAFSSDPAGGNPAGVVLDARGSTDAERRAVAAELGYSETAFLEPSGDIRYFSPLAEVPFCGHATIATAVAHAERFGPGPLKLNTRSGLVEVLTSKAADGTLTATLTSVHPRTAELADDVLKTLLATLNWSPADLDPNFPPRLAYGGAWHPILVAATRERLADLNYDFDALGALMAERVWTTVDLLWRESSDVFYARNPFPPGGVVEDPATGAAAAAFGGYLRDCHLLTPPATLTIHQGDDLGRPSLLTVGVPAVGGIAVTGTAVRL